MDGPLFLVMCSSIRKLCFRMFCETFFHERLSLNFMDLFSHMWVSALLEHVNIDIMCKVWLKVQMHYKFCFLPPPRPGDHEQSMSSCLCRRVQWHTVCMHRHTLLYSSVCSGTLCVCIGIHFFLTSWIRPATKVKRATDSKVLHSFLFSNFLYYTFGAKHQLAEILCGGILQIGMMTFTKGLSKYLAEWDYMKKHFAWNTYQK